MSQNDELGILSYAEKLKAQGKSRKTIYREVEMSPSEFHQLEEKYGKEIIPDHRPDLSELVMEIERDPWISQRKLARRWVCSIRYITYTYRKLPWAMKSRNYLTLKGRVSLLLEEGHSMEEILQSFTISEDFARKVIPAFFEDEKKE